MRPREFPAESVALEVGQGHVPGASMRPREFPAESAPAASVSQSVVACFNEAAGVPRGIPCNSANLSSTAALASMRPREFPAESQHIDPNPIQRVWLQ